MGCLHQRCARRPPGKLTEAARALLQTPPTAAELAAFGLSPADYAAETPIEVWPEHWPAFQLFATAQTQWTVGFGGPVGLHYPSLYPLIDRHAGQDATQWQELFADIQTLEREALSIFREQAAEQAEEAERQRRSRSHD